MFQPLPTKREPRRFAGSTWVNELVDAIRSSGQVQSGLTDDPRYRAGIQRVRVLAAASGGGKYTGVFLEFPDTTLALAGDLSDDDAGDEGPPCVIFNRVERNQTTHALIAAENTVVDFEGVMIGFIGGLPVIEITGYALKLCVV